MEQLTPRTVLAALLLGCRASTPTGGPPTPTDDALATDAGATTGDTATPATTATTGHTAAPGPTAETGGHSGGEAACVPTRWATLQPASARQLQLGGAAWRDLLSVGDLDGDGDDELLASETGTWIVPEPEAGGLGPGGLALLDALASRPRPLGDADGDGDPEVALINASVHPVAPGALQVWDGDGAGGLAPGRAYAVPRDFRYFEHAGGAGALAVGGTAVVQGDPDVAWWVDPLGADAPLDDAARLTVELLQHGSYGWAPGLPGDVTGDGVADLVAMDMGRVLVYDGVRRGLTVEADADATLDGAGGELAPLGDLDGDGLADLVIQPGTRYYGSDAWLVPGGALPAAADLEAVATTRWSSGNRLDSVAAVARVDDVDLDGRDDVAVTIDQDGPDASVAFVPTALSGRVDVPGAALGGIGFTGLREGGHALLAIGSGDVDGDCVRELTVAGSDTAWLFAPVP